MVKLVFLLAVLAIPSLAPAETLTGKVVAIADGDTLTMLTPERREVRVRLGEIDAPERGQPYANRSRQALAALVHGKTIRAEVQDTDRYGRTVARVFVGDLDVNAELVRRGAAWVYRKYAKDGGLYELEQEARAQRLGLWKLPEAEQIPPWEWRRGEQAPVDEQTRRSLVPERAQPGTHEPSCGDKRLCREMSSCEEAVFYLERCGLTRLDGDGDGVPCEALCR